MKITPQMLVDRHKLIELEGLEQLDGNPHRADTDALAASIDEFGQFEPIVVYRGEILIGNHRAQQFAQAGESAVAGYDLSDLELDDAHRLAMALASNRIAQLGSDDPKLLAAAINAIGADDVGLVSSAGFDLEALPVELAGLVEVDGYTRRGSVEIEEDELPAIEEDPVSKLGDIWELGRHTLICGSAFDPRVMPDSCEMILTDPPYGMNLDTDYTKLPDAASGKRYRPVIGDDVKFDMSRVPSPECAEQFWFGADWYRDSLPDGGVFLCWDKRVESKLDSVIGSMFELIWSSHRHQRVIFRHQWTGYDQKRVEGFWSPPDTETG